MQSFKIDKFHKDKVNKGEEEKCSVCLSEFEDKEEIKILPCKHLYHPECIDIWLKKNSTCPVCKTDFNKPNRNRRN
jgi:hypothetical protein